MKARTLAEHIAATYKALRIGVGVIAFILPPLLWLGGYFFGHLALEGSMSAYYHAGNGVMRNEFVGILFAVGTILIVYRGFTPLENYALNFAGTFAILIALCPMAWPEDVGGSPLSLHGIFAISFFVCIAYVCIFRASDTLSLIKEPRRQERYRMSYKILGFLMLASPAIAFVLISILHLNKSITFFVEAVGVYVFSCYWLLKSREISETNADHRAALGGLRVPKHKLTQPFRQLPVTAVE